MKIYYDNITTCYHRVASNRRRLGAGCFCRGLLDGSVSEQPHSHHCRGCTQRNLRLGSREKVVRLHHTNQAIQVQPSSWQFWLVTRFKRENAEGHAAFASLFFAPRRIMPSKCCMRGRLWVHWQHPQRHVHVRSVEAPVAKHVVALRPNQPSP